MREGDDEQAVRSRFSDDIARLEERTHRGLQGIELRDVPALTEPLRELGPLHAVTYRGILAGEGPHYYEHVFADESAPTLAADANDTLFIVGGSFDMTSRGITDRRPNPAKPSRRKLDAFMDVYEQVSQRNPLNPRMRFWDMGEVDGEHCFVLTDLNVFDDAISFNTIQTVPPDVCEKKGFASKVMNLIVHMADDHQVPMTIEPVPFGQKTLSETQLQKWYKRVGFAEDETGQLRREPMRRRNPSFRKRSNPRSKLQAEEQLHEAMFSVLVAHGLEPDDYEEGYYLLVEHVRAFFDQDEMDAVNRDRFERQLGIRPHSSRRKNPGSHGQRRRNPGSHGQRRPNPRQGRRSDPDERAAFALAKQLTPTQRKAMAMVLAKEEKGQSAIKYGKGKPISQQTGNRLTEMGMADVGSGQTLISTRFGAMVMDARNRSTRKRRRR